GYLCFRLDPLSDDRGSPSFPKKYASQDSLRHRRGRAPTDYRSWREPSRFVASHHQENACQGSQAAFPIYSRSAHQPEGTPAGAASADSCSHSVFSNVPAASISRSDPGDYPWTRRNELLGF